MKKSYALMIRVLTGLALVCSGLTPVAGEEFYEGKTVRIVVAYSPGGGYDIYARQVGRHLSKHIPGEPKIIVENRPGAGGLISGNYVYNSRRQDGTELLHIGGSAIIKQLTGAKGVQYDAAKFQYIGAPYAEATVLVVTGKSGFTGVKELLGGNAREISLGGIGTGSPNDVAAILLRDVIGAKVRLVTGYHGTARIRLAMDAGELDGMFNGWVSLNATSYDKLQSGEYRVLLQVAAEPIKDLPNVPSISDLAKTAEQRRLVRLATLVPYQFARSFMVGPKVPKERVATLRQAFADTMKDKAFLADAKKTRLTIDPITGPKLQSFVLEFLDMPEKEKAKVLGLLQ